MAKKIFFVANSASIHTMKWVDYFVRRKYDVYLASFSRENKTACKNVFFIGNKETNKRGGNYHYLLGIPKLAEVMKMVDPDIINAHYSYSMGLIALLAKKKAAINARLSVVCHGSDLLDTPQTYLFDKINQYVLSRCDQVIVVSDQLKDKAESLGINIEKIYTGQYGVDIIPHHTDFKKDIDIISNRAYEGNSRIDFLLEALDEIKEANLHIVFVLPKIKESDFHKIVRKYPHITFYRHLEYEEMIELIARSKIYISATKSDGASLSLLEALQLECIPVVSNIVSNRSWILDGVNGYLFNHKKDFLTKLHFAIESDKAKSMIDINQELMARRGNYKKQMQKIEQFLMEKI